MIRKLTNFLYRLKHQKRMERELLTAWMAKQDAWDLYMAALTEAHETNKFNDRPFMNQLAYRMRIRNERRKKYDTLLHEWRQHGMIPPDYNKLYGKRE